ncbi:histidyl-tRNA synthetase [Glaciihabitans tibetensis]|uniref:Histidyl-tRNA synthetase n=1 Tax=Glaciihabitans tibetensis TaxID=1266600 RepID=A0A2T0V4D2_9MICO|nr:ATP phosphoribosyltransferase regulatory subunit [Glaciihabitans tibetensis]PRY65033.1 histidyl-tRNA synthetase [Glaciihabitans tibetensis]
MASPVNPPRGMRDFLPADKARRERVLGVIRSTYRAHGFDEIETPVMEDSARLHAGLGGDNEKLAFGVLKRGLTAENFAAARDALDLADLGLRFDLTVPLARFYASHRSELPAVFRSIQIAPVWRAERPQKGRYRQFVQCDIDIIGEAGVLAEVELLIATSAALDALGLGGCTIRINDRRLLIGMLNAFGFPAEEHDQVLITIDKLDKVGESGVVSELRERGASSSAVDALEGYFARPSLGNDLPFGIEAISRALPDGVDASVIAELAGLGAAVDAARAGGSLGAGASGDGASSPAPLIEFDPFLVRGMGYYTGPIFEVAHPSLGYSLGGGGRYDGMIGRFLGTDVPATGFSLGFERLVDLVELPEDASTASIALVHDADVSPATLAVLKSQLINEGTRVRLVRRVKNVKLLFDALAAEGFTHFAFVSASTVDAASLERRPLGA